MLTAQEIDTLVHSHLHFLSVNETEPKFFSFIYNDGIISEEVSLGYNIKQGEIYLFIHPEAMSENARKEISFSAIKLFNLLKNKPKLRIKIATGSLIFTFDPKIIKNMSVYDNKLDESYAKEFSMNVTKFYQDLLSNIQNSNVTYSSFLVKRGFSNLFATGDDFKLVLEHLVNEKVIILQSFSSNFFRFELSCYQKVSVKEYLFIKRKVLEFLRKSDYSIW